MLASCSECSKPSAHLFHGKCYRCAHGGRTPKPSKAKPKSPKLKITRKAPFGSYAERRARGLCTKCLALAEPGKSRCTSCLKKENARERKKKRSRPGAARRALLKAKGRCTWCAKVNTTKYTKCRSCLDLTNAARAAKRRAMKNQEGERR